MRDPFIISGDPFWTPHLECPFCGRPWDRFAFASPLKRAGAYRSARFTWPECRGDH